MKKTMHKEVDTLNNLDVNKMLEEIAEAYREGNEKLAQEKIDLLGYTIFPEEEESDYTNMIRNAFLKSVDAIKDDIQKDGREKELEKVCEQFCAAVPEKESPLPAGVKGGIPCARKNDHEIYIDQRKCNSLIIGSDRTNEMLIFSMIDTISRAEQPDSFILIDPDFERAARMIPSLQNRGYQCFKVVASGTGFNITIGDTEVTISQLCASLKDKSIAVFVKPSKFVKADNYVINEFLTQFYMELAKGELVQSVHFILDEFVNLPKLEHMSDYVRTSIARNICFTFIIQAFLQLDRQYGDKDSQIIIRNCRAVFFTGTPEINTANCISQMLGAEEVGGCSPKAKCGRPITRPKALMPKVRQVMTPGELMRLKDGEMIWISDTQAIINIGKSQMIFNYEYLNNVFPKKTLQNDYEKEMEKDEKE